MKLIDYVILLIVALGFFFAVRSALKSLRKGSCSGCSNSCCGGCSKEKKQKTRS